MVCTGDEGFKPEVQEAMAAELGEKARVRYCKGGHCAMIAFEGEIVKVVAKAREESWKAVEAGGV